MCGAGAGGGGSLLCQRDWTRRQFRVTPETCCMPPSLIICFQRNFLDNYSGIVVSENVVMAKS